MTQYSKKVASPVGELTLIANETVLVAVLWESQGSPRNRTQPYIQVEKHPILDKAEEQLAEYFSGERTHFDLPVDFHGTEFQNKVWRALQKIPYGCTKSYSELAREIHSPKACRAVGSANGKNPLAIVVPCHRVIGQNGSLTGFAGGLKTKAFLVELESALLSQ